MAGSIIALMPYTQGKTAIEVKSPIAVPGEVEAA
jgi:hypothetical protein